MRGASSQAKKLLKKTGGIVKGICHPNEKYEELFHANIEWVRFDINALPFDKNGNPEEGYLAFKKRAMDYVKRGFKVMAITPNPGTFVNAGMDPRKKENLYKIAEIAKFYAKDLQGVVSAFQIANEMGIEIFTTPLTLDEAAVFLGVQLEAMNSCKKNIAVGFNFAGVSTTDLAKLMRPWYSYCDYVGLDMYPGCFEDKYKHLWYFDLMVRFLWGYTRRPVIMNEFGYMSYGLPKSEHEKKEILRNYGMKNETEARQNVKKMLDHENFPKRFRDHMYGLKHKSEEELSKKLFDGGLTTHLYREMPEGYQLKNYQHTLEGQARFFTDVIKRLSKLKCCCGAFVYCYTDYPECYICGQAERPVETGWGLVDGKSNLKPAYYAVRDAFANWKK